MAVKERWFNYRPICLVFAFLLLGSLFAFYVTNQLVLTIITAVIVAVILVIIAILKRKVKYFLVPIIAFVIGCGVFNLAVISFSSGIDYSPNEIQARIYNLSKPKDGLIVAEADSCIFNDNKINDNIIIYVYDNDGLFNNLEIGAVIKFKPYKFYKTDLFYYSTPNASMYASDTKYTTSVLMDNIEYIKTDKTFAEIIKETVKNNLKIALTNENVEIAYSALFGNKEELSTQQYNTFRLSGVAHLLAVSGLHVGIIVLILNWLLKLLKIRDWTKLAVIAAFLCFYMYICNFAISIIRATIMTLLLLAAELIDEEYDPLTAISVAGIVIYLINPLCVFDVSFLLSFSCVVGITMLFGPVSRVLLKCKIPKAIAESVAVSVSTTITITVVIAYFFKTLNIISIVANVILIPIFTIAFVWIFIVSLLSLILQPLTYLMIPVNYIIDLINIIANVLGNLSISNFNTLEFNFVAIIVYFVLLFFLSRFCTAKYKYKMITTLPMVALLFYVLL